MDWKWWEKIIIYHPQTSKERSGLTTDLLAEDYQWLSFTEQQNSLFLYQSFHVFICFFPDSTINEY